ncbi:hypothetical protein Vretimale_4728, partial [Volvox reticuliferus]
DVVLQLHACPNIGKDFLRSVFLSICVSTAITSSRMHVCESAGRQARRGVALLSLKVRQVSSSMTVEGPIASAIHRKILEVLKPTHFRLVNDSHKHAGHYARDGSAASEAGETHFRLEVTSDAFTGVPLVKRHQMIYGLLADEFRAGLHALSMTTKTPAEK